jgi:hypothetical protein
MTTPKKLIDWASVPKGARTNYGRLLLIEKLNACFRMENGVLLTRC